MVLSAFVRFDQKAKIVDKRLAVIAIFVIVLSNAPEREGRVRSTPNSLSLKF